MGNSVGKERLTEHSYNYVCSPPLPSIESLSSDARQLSPLFKVWGKSYGPPAIFSRWKTCKKATSKVGGFPGTLYTRNIYSLVQFIVISNQPPSQTFLLINKSIIIAMLPPSTVTIPTPCSCHSTCQTIHSFLILSWYLHVKQIFFWAHQNVLTHVHSRGTFIRLILSLVHKLCLNIHSSDTVAYKRYFLTPSMHGYTHGAVRNLWHFWQWSNNWENYTYVCYCKFPFTL